MLIVREIVKVSSWVLGGNLDDARPAGFAKLEMGSGENNSCLVFFFCPLHNLYYNFLEGCADIEKGIQGCISQMADSFSRR